MFAFELSALFSIVAATAPNVTPNPAPQEAQASEHVRLEGDDLVVERSCTIVCPPQPVVDHNANGVVRILGDDITVAFEGTLLGAPADTSPEALAGIGIVVRGRGVTVRGARLSGFRVGLLVEGASQATVEDCVADGNFRQALASTQEREHMADWLWPHENDAGEWAASYGAGFCFRDARGLTVRRCRVRNGQNGILLERVEGASVYDNDCSYLSGWGIALWRSNGNRIVRNACNFCIRGYSHGVYNRGQDSAGILLFEQCSDNVIVENAARHCGDGLFAFAGREALGEKGLAPELDRRDLGHRRNYIARNDFSFAAAHGLELTFSFDNVIEDNRFVGNAICGIWGGYSRRTAIRGNVFEANGERPVRRTAAAEGGAINIEHGQHNRIEGNRFRDNDCGVHLWWDPDEGLAELPWSKANGHASIDNVIQNNRFEGGTVAIRLRQAGRTFVSENRFVDVPHTLVADQTELRRVPRTPEDSESAPAGGPTHVEDALPGSKRPVEALPPGSRDAIHMLAYGPWDHATPVLLRTPVTDNEHTATASHTFHFRPVPLERVEVEGRVTFDRNEETVTVRPDGPGCIPYTLTAHHATGTVRVHDVLVNLTWNVRPFAWTADPLADPQAWRREAAAVERDVELRELFLPALWAALGEESQTPAFANRERFGLTATADVQLPAGPWVLHAGADDGLRVTLDEGIVVEDWSRHGFRSHEVPLNIDEARTLRVRVEYFELDGAEALEVRFRPGE